MTHTPSTATRDSDQLILNILSTIEIKKKQIGQAERPAWNTHCAFRFDPNSNVSTNIQTTVDIDLLVKIHAHLSINYNAYQQSLKTLGLKDIPYNYLGFSYAQWCSDIETRLSILELKSKRKELTDLEQRASALISEDQRRQIELDKLVKDIANI